jgi:hypothetical protein
MGDDFEFAYGVPNGFPPNFNETVVPDTGYSFRPRGIRAESVIFTLRSAF